MAEKFLILGRAGSGKTSFVLEKFYQYIRAHSTNKVIFLLPTHSQVEHLKDVIIRSGPARGFVDNSLFTFSQLAREILNKKLPGRVVSELGKEYILRELLQESSPGYLQNFNEHRGLRFALLRFFKELKESALYPKEFKRKTEQFVEEGELAEAGDEKYKALAEVYFRFQQVLEGKKLCDEEDVLNAALMRLERDRSLMQERHALIVDGFHSFTPVEFRLLKSLVERTPNVYLTLVLDIDSFDSPIFRGCREVYERLRPLGFKEVSVGDSESRRFTSNKVLAHIEKHLFTRSPAIINAEAEDGLEVVEAANMEDEVEQMARRIYKMVSNGTARFNDIGIIFRDVVPYANQIEGVFSRYGIPVRIYARKPLAESPLVRSVMTLARICATHWADDTDVYRTLKSPYIGLLQDEVERLEREALKRGIFGSSNRWMKLVREGQWPETEAFLEKLLRFEKEVSAPKVASTFRRWFITLIGECIRLPGAANTSYEDIVKKEAGALNSFLSLLDTLSGVLEDRPIAFSRFIEELSHSISFTSYTLKDKRHEVVNVIDALEARQWELQVVFVGGLLEGQFPRQARENLFLRDRERRVLNCLTGTNLKEVLGNVAEEECFLFYIALTRARKRLVLSYPIADSRGNPNIPSFFLREVKRLFSPTGYGNVFLQRTPADLIPKAEDILTHKDLRGFTCYYLRAPYRKGSRSEAYHRLARSIYNKLLRKDLLLVEDLKVAMNNPGESDIGLHRKVVMEITSRYKATQFSDYAQCPFLHFARYILRLKAIKSLAEEGLNPPLQGEIIHETLMRYYRDERAGRDIAAIFKEVFAAKVRGMRIGLNELRLRDEMLQALESVVRKDKEYEAILPFRPRYIEESFGSNGKPALEIHDDELGTVRITGRLDRIDVGEIDGECVGLVLDYKYSREGLTKDKLKKIEEEGVDLQLPIYMMVARECLGVKPIGAQLYPLKPPARSGVLDARVRLSAPSLPTKGAFFMSEKDMERLIEHSREHILRYAREIISGSKEVNPRDMKTCVAGGCEFLDVCRFEKRSAGKKGG